MHEGMSMIRVLTANEMTFIGGGDGDSGNEGIGGPGGDTMGTGPAEGDYGNPDMSIGTQGQSGTVAFNLWGGLIWGALGFAGGYAAPAPGSTPLQTGIRVRPKTHSFLTDSSEHQSD
jgi:hypothetical protein